MPRLRFSDLLYLVPFGRFRIDRNRTEDASANFIGREAYRAQMIDTLTGEDRRGAILVTGRRGVGKTSFVESSLKEYDAAVFRRFLRSNYGRSAIDHLMLAILALIIGFTALVITDLIEYFSVTVRENTIAVFPLIIFVIASFIPFAYGYLALGEYGFSFSPMRFIW